MLMVTLNFSLNKERNKILTFLIPFTPLRSHQEFLPHPSCRAVFAIYLFAIRVWFKTQP